MKTFSSRMRRRSRQLSLLLLLGLILGIVTASPASAAWSPNPFGAFDIVTKAPGGLRVAGWGIDASSGSTALNVHVYVDGRFAGAGVANGYRPDVGAAYPFGNYHGYDFGVAATGGTHTVCVYLLNVGGVVDKLDRSRDRGEGAALAPHRVCASRFTQSGLHAGAKHCPSVSAWAGV
jgi:hypothetical protein